MKNTTEVKTITLDKDCRRVLGTVDDTPLDTYLTLVSDKRRRGVVRRLRDRPDGEATVEDLVDHLYGNESDLSTEECPHRERISIQLIHNHLPKLADHGVIRYDRERGVVRYRSDERIETVLDALPREAARCSPRS